jgi:hypothetical protein
MIPIAEPGNLISILLLSIMLGTPTAILSLVIFLVLEWIPMPGARKLLPAIGALAILILTLSLFPGARTPGEYRQTWALMMFTGFLMAALFILAPFPLFRVSFRYFPPSGVVYFTALSAVFILISAGVIGWDAMIPPATETGMVLARITLAAEELTAATVVYGGLALLEGLFSPERKGTP